MKRKTAYTTSLLIFAVLAAAIGCGEPQVAPGNLRLTMALRTALSARQSEWLAACREQVETRRQAGEMSDDEYVRFQTIFTAAADGNWEAAERDVVRWQKGQRPPAQ
jgi:hypothetical protein